MPFLPTRDIDTISDSKVASKISTLLFGLVRSPERYRQMSPDSARLLLTRIVEALDESDEADAFGREGWRDALFEAG